MATPTPIPAPAAPQPACPKPNPRKWVALRPWVQTGFLALWLAPLGRWLHGAPGCVFHCYSCPLSAFGCPIGLLANYAAIFPAVPTTPFLLLGVMLIAGSTVGSLICGWACPFGYLQDLLAKVRQNKLALPGWLGYGRYAVLVGLVLVLPFLLSRDGTLFEDQPVSICRLCPAGALEAGLYYSAASVVAGTGWIMSWGKLSILVGFLVAAVVIHRPWCRVFCPLGGLLALFNRFSLFHLRFNATQCSECNSCRSRCPFGVKVDQQINVAGCIRCLECTTCGAIEPVFAGSHQKAAPTSACSAASGPAK